MRIAIGTPSGDMVHADYAMALASLASYTAAKAREGNVILLNSAAKNKIETISFINEKSSIIQKGRHDTVNTAFALKADKLFFLDSDMVFPPDLLCELLRADKDIVGCNYITRRAPYKPTCKDLSGRLVAPENTELLEVGAIATGCLLISMRVFKAIGKPYFSIGYKDDVFFGEDYFFCEQAKEVGFKIYCDTKLSKKVLHIGTLSCGL